MAIVLTHTNASGTRRIEIEDPSRVVVLRDEETPFGMQSVLSSTGMGIFWVDGCRRDVEKRLCEGDRL